MVARAQRHRRGGTDRHAGRARRRSAAHVPSAVRDRHWHWTRVGLQRTAAAVRAGATPAFGSNRYARGGNPDELCLLHPSPPGLRVGCPHAARGAPHQRRTHCRRNVLCRMARAPVPRCTGDWGRLTFGCADQSCLTARRGMDPRPARSMALPPALSVAHLEHAWSRGRTRKSWRRADAANARAAADSVGGLRCARRHHPG